MCLLEKTRQFSYYMTSLYPLKIYKNSLLKHLLTAAKVCIPALWKSTVPPTRSHRFAIITEIQQMEKNLTMTLREQAEKYRKVWAPYLTYREQIFQTSQQ